MRGDMPDIWIEFTVNLVDLAKWLESYLDNKITESMKTYDVQAIR
jgi:hypothetical protein